MSKMKIQIKGITAFGFHGVFEHEKINGQEFIVDVELSYNAASALVSDNIADAVDYGAVVNLVKKIIESTRRDLIEVLADDLAVQLLEISLVDKVKVTLHKPFAPVEVKVSDIAVIVEKSK
jgi:dihydroneopterin aldolase